MDVLLENIQRSHPHFKFNSSTKIWLPERIPWRGSPSFCWEFRVNRRQLRDRDWPVESHLWEREVLINVQFDKLDALQPLRDGKDVAALRNLRLIIQSHICALGTLGKPKSSYGSLLGTKLIKLVPSYKLQEKTGGSSNKWLNRHR